MRKRQYELTPINGSWSKGPILLNGVSQTPQRSLGQHSALGAFAPTPLLDRDEVSMLRFRPTKLTAALVSARLLALGAAMQNLHQAQAAFGFEVDIGPGSPRSLRLHLVCLLLRLTEWSVSSCRPKEPS